MLRYIYRLTEVQSKNSLAWEDGPGSLRNIVSVSTKRILWEREASESFGKELMSRGIVEGKYDSWNGFVEFWYRLERRPLTSKEDWEYVGSPEPRKRRRRSWDCADY